MVATDVASRGIGMIKAPSPHAAKPSAYTVVALLSTLRRLLDCVILPGSFRVFWFSLMGVLEMRVQHVLCYAREFLAQSTFPGTRYGIGIS